MKNSFAILVLCLFVFSATAQDKPRFTADDAAYLTEITLQHLQQRPDRAAAMAGEANTEKWFSQARDCWVLVNVLEQFPEISNRQAISDILDQNLSEKHIASLTRQFTNNSTTIFNSSTGWAWTMKLQAALDKLPDQPDKSWRALLRPLTDQLKQQYLQELMMQNPNAAPAKDPETAFKLSLAWDYAVASEDILLKEMLQNHAMDLYLNDDHCQAHAAAGHAPVYVPCLTQAALMQRTMPVELFSAWIDRYLPELKNGIPDQLPIAATATSAPDAVNRLSAAAALLQISIDLPQLKNSATVMLQQTLQTAREHQWPSSQIAAFAVLGFEND